MAALSMILHYCPCNQEGTHNVLHHSGAQDEREEEEEKEEEDLAWMHRHCRRAEGGGRPGGSFNSREQPQNEVDQVRRTRIDNNTQHTVKTPNLSKNICLISSQNV